MGEKTRIIAIDYGQKRIGIAYSDITHLIAMTHPTLAAGKKIEKTVQLVVSALRKHEKEFDYSIDRLVVGKPLLMSGKNSLMTDEVLVFIDLLSKEFTCPIIAWDERLTSAQAERALMESSLTRKKRAKHVDQVSASIILQSYLDHLHLKNRSL